MDLDEEKINFISSMKVYLLKHRIRVTGPESVLTSPTRVIE